MRKSVYPVLAAALGIVAAGLRMWQRAAGYDESGLPIPFAFPSIVLTVFLLLCAGAFLALALRRPEALEDQDSALPRGTSAAVMFAAAGVLVLLGGMWNLILVARNYLSFSNIMYASLEEQQKATRVFLNANLLPGVVALASVPAAIALLHRAELARTGGEKPNTFSVMMPPVFCWLWLIEVYRQHTSNPIVWDYVLLLFAVAALLISTYERAGFAFGVGKPRRTMFTTPLALMLAVAALPDSGGLANAAPLIALGLHTAAELTALLQALENTPAGPEATEESIQQEDVPHEQ